MERGLEGAREGEKEGERKRKGRRKREGDMEREREKGTERECERRGPGERERGSERIAGEIEEHTQPCSVLSGSPLQLVVLMAECSPEEPQSFTATYCNRSPVDYFTKITRS